MASPRSKQASSAGEVGALDRGHGQERGRDPVGPRPNVKSHSAASLEGGFHERLATSVYCRWACCFCVYPLRRDVKGDLGRGPLSGPRP
jgi:hypothetical protein